MAADSNAELMTDYLDDALEGAEAESFAKLLAESPDAAREAEALKRMLSLVRELPELEAPPDFYEKVAKKIRRRRMTSPGAAGLVAIPLQVISILVILVIAATYLMLEIEREDAKIEKDPTAKSSKPAE
ncbi:anti-sigma factor family protein [Nannocystaceae bacterium ST9]